MSDNENNIFGTQDSNTNTEQAPGKTQETDNTVNMGNNQESNAQENKIYSDAQPTDSGDFSAYNDPVEDEPPRMEKEPEYSPYSNQYTGQQQYSQYNNSYSQPQTTVDAAPAKKKNKGFMVFMISLVCVIVAVILILFGYNYVKNKNTNNSTANGDSTQISINETPKATNTSGTLTTEEIAAQAKKFNVGILLYGKAQSFSSSSANSLVGEGSGIIMSEDSSGKYTYILTCAHVISGVKTSGYTMTVQDSDGNTYDGILVGYDEKTDVGVIKIEKTGLTCAEFGNSSALQIGQTIYAIGNPGGTEFFGSFTNGVVSAIDRPISSESGYEMKCIQHNAAISSGNSGGALLNAYGQVVGINSSKIVSTGYEGMAFAIPISDAQEIINDIIANGYVTNRPKLGISYAAASNYQQYAMVVKLKDLPSGSLIIASISNDSSLAKTEAKVGDLITAVDGKNLDTADVLLDRIESGKVGDTLKLTLCRVNDDYSIDTFEVTVTLIEDTGSSTSANEEQSTTQNYWEQYFNNGY